MRHMGTVGLFLFVATVTVLQSLIRLTQPTEPIVFHSSSFISTGNGNYGTGMIIQPMCQVRKSIHFHRGGVGGGVGGVD